MKLERVKIKHFEGIHEVDVRFEEHERTVILSGDNGAGKTSFFNAVATALRSKHGVKSETIVQQGADGTEVVVMLNSGHRFTMTARPGEKVRMRIEAPDGEQLRQAWADDRIGKTGLFYDPVQFANLNGEQQLAMLAAATGRTDELAMLAGEVRDAEDQRRMMKSKLRDLQGSFREGEIPYPDAPREAFSIEDLTTALSEAQEENARIDEARRTGEAWIREAGREEEETAQAREREEARRAEFDEWARARDEAAAGQRAAGEAAIAEAEAMGPPTDVSDLKRTVDQAGEQLRRAHVNERYTETLEKLKAMREAVDEAEGAVEEARTARQRFVEECGVDVPGLEVTSDGLTLHGVPFADASSGERLTAATLLAMGMAADLGVLFVRDASVLDDANRKLIAATAATRQTADGDDFQVFFEMVDAGARPAIVLEEGHVKTDNRAKVEEVTA